MMRLAPWQFAAINNPFSHFAFFGGVGTGKSFSGSQFAINMMRTYPELTGFIGANTYDQMSQATLREMFYWLDFYKIPFVINEIPPPSWGARRQFATYKNILSCKIGNRVAHAFVRVLSDPDALRGVEFSWYWLDETRDTPQNSHDIILSRMRESQIKKGIITTTTNGEDWAHDRFFAKARKGQRLYGSMHVPTILSVKHGILDQPYYDQMLHSYSPLMVEQELFARHVNVTGGIAYYSCDPTKNAMHLSPWGEEFPNPERELIVGCDFNFNPAPHIWMIGQRGPYLYGPNGVNFNDCIHWFGEIAESRMSTPEMALRLINRYPGFFYKVFGDRSGARSTTSNAGKPDYDQIAEVLIENDCNFTIDTDNGNNPLVRNRVENMNRLFCDGKGIRRQTYNPITCTHFDRDVKGVGWKQNTLRGQGRLDDGGDKRKTHATDGAGYAMWKEFPYRRAIEIIDPIKNIASQI